MTTARLEAFSDGVLAIIITIMVLELEVPHGHGLAALQELLPSLLSYVLSFLYIGIYWNNHHHMCQLMQRVSGPILWANLHLLFWLSLIPFATRWMGENHFAPMSTAIYGVPLLMAGVAYWLLVRAIIAAEGKSSLVARAVGSDRKGNISVVIYVLAIPSAFISSWIAGGLYLMVALIWIVPDRRMERALVEASEE